MRAARNAAFAVHPRRLDQIANRVALLQFVEARRLMVPSSASKMPVPTSSPTTRTVCWKSEMDGTWTESPSRREEILFPADVAQHRREVDIERLADAIRTHANEPRGLQSRCCRGPSCQPDQVTDAHLIRQVKMHHRRELGANIRPGTLVEPLLLALGNLLGDQAAKLACDAHLAVGSGAVRHHEGVAVLATRLCFGSPAAARATSNQMSCLGFQGPGCAR